MSYAECDLVIDLDVRDLCKWPYYNHPKGCPNYGKKKGCPPTSRLITDLLDLNKPVFAIWNCFDFAGHCKQMRQKHPDWSKRQIECCLYWQPKARKQLHFEIKKFFADNKGFAIINNPESVGINVTQTMAEIGIELEWPPETKTYQVALVGKPLMSIKSGE